MSLGLGLPERGGIEANESWRPGIQIKKTPPPSSSSLSIKSADFNAKMIYALFFLLFLAFESALVNGSDSFGSSNHTSRILAERQKQVYYHSAHKKKVPEDEDGTKYIALTFDDGPHQVLTPRLLDTLKEKNAKATFYVMGVKVDIHPDIVARAFREGHEIGNHVYDHPVLTKIKPQELDHQVQVTSNSIRSAIGTAPRTLRPPYGNTNRKVNNEISSKHGMDVVFWSYDTIDWRFPKKDDIVAGALKHVTNGAIVLAHDVHTNTIEAMPDLIDALQKEKYKLITVSELIEKFYPYT